MNNKENNFVSAVIYLHKEDNNTFDFLSMLSRVMADNFKNYELICVNDEVGDNIIEEVRRFRRENESVILSIVTMGFRHGLEASMNAGIDLAIGDFIFEFDSCYVDYDESLIMEIYHKSLEGFDIVSAVPPKARRRLSSRLFYSVYNYFSTTENDLMTERFCIISRRAVNRVSSYSRTVPYRKAVYASSGLKIEHIYYQETDAKSGLMFSDIEKNNTAMDSIILFTKLAYRVSLFISIVMALFMVGTGLYTVIVYFGQNKPVAGWAPLMGLISIGFCALFVILTIVIKYLEVLLKLVFTKQKYLISSIDKL